MPLPLNAYVGRNIRHRRWMLGMPREQLAEKLGLPPEQIQRLEDGLEPVSTDQLMSIAAAMQVPTQSFCNGTCHYCA